MKPMKLTSLMVMLLVGFSAAAQEEFFDDVYFSSSKKDKKEKPDARKYAALRELMTEFIGVPTTLCAGLVAESFTGKKKKKGSTSYKNTKAVLSLLGICVAAGYLVPQFCNMFMPPVMKKLMPSYDPNGGVSSQSVSSVHRAQVAKPNVQINNKVKKVNMYPQMPAYFSSGMKV